MTGGAVTACAHCGRDTAQRPATMLDILGPEKTAELIARERDAERRIAARRAALRRARR